MGMCCAILGFDCCKTPAQKAMEKPNPMNEVGPSGKIGMEKNTIRTEYCNRYKIDSRRVAQWLEDRCTTTLVSEFVQSSGNDGDNSGKALILKENEIDMIILRCRNISNGYESDAEKIDNDEYGNDDKYLTTLGWQMLCNLIESNANTLRVIYFEGIFVTKGRMELLCNKVKKLTKIEEIAFVECKINFDKDRHLVKVKDESDSQGRNIEKRTYDGAWMMVDAVKDIESIMIVCYDDIIDHSPILFWDNFL